MESALSSVEVVAGLIEEAHRAGASDIHIDPTEASLRVRMRVDGILQDVGHVPKSIHAEVIARVKVLASMRSDEHQATQDGRFRHISPDGHPVDIRVSIAPTYHGENVVLRLLSQGDSYTLATLGLSEANQKKIMQALRRPHGMILSTGPTGSGKTTTLYTLLGLLNQSEVSIVTIEDPIEYAVDSIKQMQVNPRAGLTFASGLRSILRQDPNIIMVGEIRDSETAHIAVNTALTGHLLLSTLHTKSAAATLPRLLDMGVDAYLVASTISLAIGQRLVRTLCPECKKLAAGKERRHVAVGCETCLGSGYRGRSVISEVLLVDENIRDAISQKTSAAEIQALAVAAGMTGLYEDGLAKVERGETSLEEVLRVVHE